MEIAQRGLLFRGVGRFAGCRQLSVLSELLGVGEVGRFVWDLEGWREDRPDRSIQARDEGTDPGRPRDAPERFPSARKQARPSLLARPLRARARLLNARAPR